MSDGPAAILDRIVARATSHLASSTLSNEAIRHQIDFLSRCSTRAGIRLVMACLLAKIDKPTIDPRKPYIQIGGGDAFSGRHYDETYIERLVTLRRLPVNRTTAFLTPALRNINHVLTPGLKIEGRPREMYTAAFSLLEAVHLGVADAESLLAEAIRVLLTIRDERDALRTLLLASFRRADEMLPLSSEEIVKLIADHLRRRNASRLPVLAVAAAYKAAEDQLAERARPLRSHNVADEQIGARGDIEILAEDDSAVCPSLKEAFLVLRHAAEALHVLQIEESHE